MRSPRAAGRSRPAQSAERIGSPSTTNFCESRSTWAPQRSTPASRHLGAWRTEPPEGGRLIESSEASHGGPTRRKVTSRRTKIVCTIGPAVGSREGIADLVKAGMNVARINCSHGDWDSRKRWIEWIRGAAREQETHVGILLDLSGPKFRLGDLPDGVVAHPGEVWTVGSGVRALPIPQKEILDKLVPGKRLLVADGEVSFKVTRSRGADATLTCLSGGVIKSRQGITLVGEEFDVPTVTKKDREDLRIGAGEGVDFVAQSYVRRAEDLQEIGAIAAELDPTLQIIAKIEMKSAVRDLTRILRESDGLMVARGDLGLQMPIEEVPLIQKKIISMCNAAGKPVITATQMMESMVMNPRPTRAEATDVANAILDGTDAVMLSGETASGKYPIAAVRYVSSLAEKTERSTLFERTASLQRGARSREATEAVASSACEIAEDLKAKAVLSFSTSGFTARMVARFRPRVPILCASYREKTARQVSVLWGVQPVLTQEFYDTEEMITKGFTAAIERGILKPGDLVVITAGIPVGRPGTTNMVTLMQVYDPRSGA
ncbi:MAG: pyruvate kinase [Armatimonadetes bacterium]|nr:pyruvate kinase [Armatimonadota bacterium]